MIDAKVNNILFMMVNTCTNENKICVSITLIRLLNLSESKI